MGNLRKYIDVEKKMKDTMKDQIFGLIRACDPVSIGSMIHECKDQVVDAELFTDYILSIVIDDILNQLIREGKIELESLYDDDFGCYRVNFRLKVG